MKSQGNSPVIIHSLNNSVNTQNFNIYLHAFRTYLDCNAEIYPGIEIPKNIIKIIDNLTAYMKGKNSKNNKNKSS